MNISAKSIFCRDITQSPPSRTSLWLIPLLHQNRDHYNEQEKNQLDEGLHPFLLSLLWGKHYQYTSKEKQGYTLF